MIKTATVRIRIFPSVSKIASGGCGLNPSNCWLPLPPGGVSTPFLLVPAFITNAETIPEDSIPVPDDFDFDNPDLCAVFNGPVEPTQNPVYEKSLEADFIIPPYYEIDLIEGRLRSFIEVESFAYKLKQTQEQPLTIKVKAEVTIPFKPTSYQLSGEEAGLYRNYILDASHPTWFEYQQNEEEYSEYFEVCVVGEFFTVCNVYRHLLSGQDVTLAKTGAIDGFAGDYQLIGQDAILKVIQGLKADYAIFSLSGQLAEFDIVPGINAVAGNFSLTGQDAGSIFNRVLSAAYAPFGLTGYVAGLFRTAFFEADAVHYTLFGQITELAIIKLINAELGSYTLSGQDSEFIRTYTFEAFAASFTLSGQDATLDVVVPATPEVAIVSYTGNGTSVSVTTGFKPGFVWVKRTNSTENHWIFPSSLNTGSGTRYALNWGSSSAASSGSNIITYDSNGFTVKDFVGNSNGNPYWGLAIKEFSTPSTNTDGSKTTQVSLNSNLGVSQFTYDPDGVSGTLGHGLGAAPELVFIYVTGYSAGHMVGGSLIGDNKFLSTSSTSAADTSTQIIRATTSSTVGIGQGDPVSRSGSSLAIGIAFTSVSGASKLGTFTGNGSATQSITGLGFEPGWLLVKSYNGGTSNWVTFNSTRDGRIIINGSPAESATDYITFDSDGFTLESGAGMNSSGVDYLYMAFLT
jgi:hypothetical protein